MNTMIQGIYILYITWKGCYNIHYNSTIEVMRVVNDTKLCEYSLSLSFTSGSFNIAHSLEMLHEYFYLYYL